MERFSVEAVEERHRLFNEFEKLLAVVLTTNTQLLCGDRGASDRYIASRDAIDAFVQALIYGAPNLNIIAAREDEARWVAQCTLKMSAEELRAGGMRSSTENLIDAALKTLAEARKQIAEAQTKG